MLGSLSSKTQQKIGILKADSIGRGAKFINDPIALPDIDWIPEHEIISLTQDIGYMIYLQWAVCPA